MSCAERPAQQQNALFYAVLQGFLRLSLVLAQSFVLIVINDIMTQAQAKAHFRSYLNHASGWSETLDTYFLERLRRALPAHAVIAYYQIRDVTRMSEEFREKFTEPVVRPRNTRSYLYSLLTFASELSEFKLETQIVKDKQSRAGLGALIFKLKTAPQGKLGQDKIPPKVQADYMAFLIELHDFLHDDKALNGVTLKKGLTYLKAVQDIEERKANELSGLKDWKRIQDRAADFLADEIRNIVKHNEPEAEEALFKFLKPKLKITDHNYNPDYRTACEKLKVSIKKIFENVREKGAAKNPNVERLVLFAKQHFAPNPDDYQKGHAALVADAEMHQAHAEKIAEIRGELINLARAYRITIPAIAR